MQLEKFIFRYKVTDWKKFPDQIFFQRETRLFIFRYSLFVDKNKSEDE